LKNGRNHTIGAICLSISDEHDLLYQQRIALPSTKSVRGVCAALEAISGLPISTFGAEYTKEAYFLGQCELNSATLA